MFFLLGNIETIIIYNY